MQNSEPHEPVWCRPDKHGLVLYLTIQPGAKSTEVVGVYGDTLKIRVNTPAVKGKANDALLTWLAGQLQLRRQMLALISSETSRYKKVRVNTTASAKWVAQQLLGVTLI